ncbi:MAG: hypothetical protein ACREX0_10445, partial [Noviherbaspirillum sp.]
GGTNSVLLLSNGACASACGTSNTRTTEAAATVCGSVLAGALPPPPPHATQVSVAATAIVLIGKFTTVQFA